MIRESIYLTHFLSLSLILSLSPALFLASLAQVHIAHSKDGKQKFAVKVQHEGLLAGANVRFFFCTNSCLGIFWSSY